MTDAATQLSEKATFCKLNDEKRPSLVGLPDFTTSQVCPEDLSKGVDEVTSAYPDGWFIRIMFDELLDPNIETLTPILDSEGMDTGTSSGSIAATHPVTLMCESINGGMVSVDYDGYYQPAGNRVTWPLGPSLVIKPNDPKLIATNTECTVTINNDVVRDKSGEKVPDNEKGPYKFRTSAIAVIAIDPPDDPMGEAPIDAIQLYFDNAYVQFNTVVDPNSLCPDADGDGLCDSEAGFSFKDVAHPDEGPGYCNNSGATCGTLADCPSGMGDTVCGRGLCNDGTYSKVCNVEADCATGTTCITNYAYTYGPYGGTFPEFGLGPLNPLETEHSYVFSLTPGVKLKDRCGKESTIAMTSADDMTLSHFTTNPFKLNKTNIVSGETAAGTKKLQFNFSNTTKGGDAPRQPSTNIDAATGTEFTMSPLPKVGTPGSLTDIALANLIVTAADGSGNLQINGFLEMNKEYTATLKAGATIDDFYGKTYTNPTDVTITWKTAPAIQMTTIGVRNDDWGVSVGDKGTVEKSAPDVFTNIILTFNQALDPTTLDASDFTIDPAPAMVTFGKGTGPFSSTSTRDCTAVYTSCRLRINALFQPGTYKFTLKKDASFTDVFGLVYTQAADQTITFTVKEAPPPIQCL